MCWAVGFHHVMASISLGERFETYELFLSLILNFFGGGGAW
jgi:hypothetical protein